MKKSICSIALLFVMLSLPAYAADFDFFGNIQFHNDVLSWQVTTGAATVTVFTSSWDDGNFDPILQVWGPDGTLLYQQDDGGVAGITLSIGQSYRAIPLISDPLAYPITGASRLKKETCTDSSHILF